MSIAIYGGARASDKAVSGDRTEPRKGFLVRIMDALAASRIREARHTIQIYAHLLASEPDTLAFEDREGGRPQ